MDGSSTGFTISGVDSEDKENGIAAFVLVKNFLTSGEAYSRLRLTLRRLAGQDQMTIVRQEIYFGLGVEEEDYYHVSFNMDWNLYDYIRSEISKHGEFSVASIFTLTGDLKDTYGATCAQYLKWQWPESDYNLLEGLEEMHHHGEWRKSLLAMSVTY